jgi:copper chaperone CopZ
MKKNFQFLGLFSVLLFLAATGLWFYYHSDEEVRANSYAEYQIDKLTCASCVNSITDTLLQLKGVGSVEVNLTSNRGKVTFDSSLLDSKTIGLAITEAGYPAVLRLEMDPDDYALRQTENKLLAEKYLARVGDRFLTRTDYESMVLQRLGSAASSDQKTGVWQKAWPEILQRELLLFSAECNNVTIHDAEVSYELDVIAKKHPGFETLIKSRYGSLDSFRAILREDMIINRNIENHVIAGITDQKKQQEAVQAWFAQLKENTEVVIFDPAIKAISLNRSGGCACCNS